MAERVAVQTIFQHAQDQAGAAALGMVLSHLGRSLTIDRLADACGPNLTVTDPSPLGRAAALFGATARIEHCDATAALDATVPAIVTLSSGTFAVLEGMEDGKVCLNLPTDGPVHLTPEEFAARFGGTLVTLETGPDFKAGEPKRSLSRMVRDHLTGGMGAIVMIVIASVLLQLPNLTVPAFTQVFIDQVLLRDLSAWLFPLVVGLLVMVVFAGAVTAVQLHAMKRLESQVSVTSAAGMVWRSLLAPVLYYAHVPVGDVVSKIASARRFASLLTGSLGTNFSNLVTSLFYLIILLLYSLPLGALSVVLSVVNVGLVRLVDRKRSALNTAQIQLVGQSCSVAINGFKAIETMKSMGQEDFLFAKQAELSAKTIANQQRIDALSLTLNVAPKVLTAINAAIVLSLGALLVIDGNMTIGELVAFQMLTKRFSKPVQALVDGTQDLQELKSRLVAVDQVSHAPVDPVAAPRERQPITRRLTGHIELKDIRFAYSLDEPPLIDNLSLTITPGSRIAFVGASGSGKSTLCRIALGLYAPNAGAVLFDGQPIEMLPRPVWAASVGYVSQDVSLFEGTIRENIGENLPIAAIRRAAQDAEIDDIITARAGGYDALVTENGTNFSGGQRQRIEIARALAHDPQILVLDEATSALDPETEKLIDANLRRRGCTCLIVAHRLSTLRDADEIICLDQGRIVERGTHDELVKLNGHYAQLLKLA